MTTIATPPEQASRRPRWREAVSVVLADGATWQLPDVRANLVFLPEPCVAIAVNGDETDGDLTGILGAVLLNGVPLGNDSHSVLRRATFAAFGLLAMYDMDYDQAATLTIAGFFHRDDFAGLMRADAVIRNEWLGPLVRDWNRIRELFPVAGIAFAVPDPA